MTTNLPLSQKQRRYLKQQSHHLPVIVSMGSKGLTDAVIEEIKIALDRHELIKVKLLAVPKAEKQAFVETISEKTGSYNVNLIGHIGIFYSAPSDTSKEKKYSLPKN